ncbi:MAG TPA: PadR family transcriptional regulator [Candidatus Acidoferrales bacterium]|nr:PadR family transcriptional regulator [Candidatus Acidoferrales bacterium]
MSKDWSSSVRARKFLDLLFFTAMREGPAYGYELNRRFRKMSGGHMRISYGTIYPMLRRMERTGLIRSRKDGSSRRVYYELTKRGARTQASLAAKLKDRQGEMEERFLGMLSMYGSIFGPTALRTLLKRSINK